MARVETIVFLSLILDLFAFTIPLPLFPRIIEWYNLVSFGHVSFSTESSPKGCFNRGKAQILPVSCLGH